MGVIYKNQNFEKRVFKLERDFEEMVFKIDCITSNMLRPSHSSYLSIVSGAPICRPNTDRP